MPSRRFIIFALALCVASCGGPNTRLVTVRPGGSGDLEFEVKNLTDVAINTFYLARTETVEKAGGRALDPNSPEGSDIWGPNLSGGAIQVGKSERMAVSGAGLWEARAVDRDGREQLITHLRLAAGGRYILELYESGWRNYSH